jgi:CubicO group peptidase (beta-lactamase class C family)
MIVRIFLIVIFLSQKFIKSKKKLKMSMKRNSKIIVLAISLALITFIGVFPSQILAYKYKKDDYWPDWDKWRQCDPELQDMNWSVIEKMYGFIEEDKLNIQSIIIVRNGYIVNEEYLNDSIRMDQKQYYWPEANPILDLREGRLHSCWSVTKSIVSLLTGIAIDMGYFDLDTKFFDVFPNMWSDDYLNETCGDAKKDINVRNMLVQNSGIQWNELVSVPVWAFYDFSLDYYLRQPLDYLPGENHMGFIDEFTYSSGNQEMLSVMIANKSGMTMADFARKYLFKPLKIRDSEWDWWGGASAYGTDDLSIKYHGGFGLFMTHQALARIGLMCLNEGKWRGRQVVSAEWIEESTSTQIFPYNLFPYGYLWWIGSVSFQASGLFGQKIVVIPEHDIVVAITANEVLGFNLVNQFIVPAVNS